MKINDVVKHKETGVLGSIQYSRYGFSVHYIENGVFVKTLGSRREDLEQYWEVVDLPDGYYIDEHGRVMGIS